MKWTRNELERMEGSIQIDEDFEIEDTIFDSFVFIQGVRDIHVEGIGFMNDETGIFDCDLQITGVMLCPDSITGELLEVPLETEVHEAYSFEEVDDEDIRIVTDDVIDFLPAVIDAILLEVPISVTEASEDDYPSGDGWRIVSEAEYQESLKDRMDPRLAKLKEFKSE